MARLGSKKMWAMVMAAIFVLSTVGFAWAAEKPQAGDQPKVEKKAAPKAAKKAAVSKAWVKQLQEALNKSGQKVKVDGVLGKETRAALKAYQKANNLKVTGRADKATQEKLGLKPMK